MTSQEIYDEMKTHWDVFDVNHKRFAEKGVKAAGVRARKAIHELKKLSSRYRTACLEETKGI